VAIPEIHIHIHDGADEARVTHLEEQVVSLVDDVVALNAKVTEYNEDVQAKIAAVQAQIDAITSQVGNVDALQSAFNDLSGTVTAGVTAVGDADADGNPAAPETPTP
jgi:uncharacterized protein YoxC